MGASKPTNRGYTARRDALITSNLWIVPAVAGAICNGSTPVMMKEDAISAGYVALVEAGRTFDGPTARFTGYAFSRVRGAVIDELRAAYAGAFILGVNLDNFPSEDEDEIELEGLDKTEEYVISKYLTGYSMAEVDRMLGKYRGWAARIKKKALSKISRG